MYLSKIHELVTAYNSHGKYFQLVSSLVCPPGSPDYRLIERGYDEMRRTCRDQKRDDDTPYYRHPRAVSVIQIAYLGVRDPEVVTEGLVHDLPEDFPSEWTYEKMATTFTPQIALNNWWITKPSVKLFSGDKFLRDLEYHSKLLNAPRRAIVTKAPDRLHNTVTLGNSGTEKQQRKQQETYHFYLPLFQKHNLLFHETVEALSELRNVKPPEEEPEVLAPLMDQPEALAAE